MSSSSTTATKRRVLDLAAEVTGGAFVAGAFVADEEGAPFDGPGYHAAVADIADRGGTPVIFPSHGLNQGSEDEWLAALTTIGSEVDRFLGFELGPMFVPYGRILSLEAYRGLLEIPQCVGAKHSSLERELEWQRLALRGRCTPRVHGAHGQRPGDRHGDVRQRLSAGACRRLPRTGSRRAIRCGPTADPGFHQLNDLLQYLGHFTFRPPVPGYRHNAAQFLELRGWAESDNVPAGAPRRPESDVAVLRDIGERLGVL